MSISKAKFGVNKDGAEVTEYTMENANGMKVSFLDLGGVITKIIVPDREGNFDDVVLGYDDVSRYEVNKPGFGAPIGRYANRISNGKVVISGKEYQMDQNDGTNCLHGGFLRYNYLMYDAECECNEGSDTISFSRLSPDGEQGLPGNATITITYTLNDENELMISYYAVSDADTIMNLTNHSYFNLGDGGHKCKDVLEQEVWIDADAYTPVDEILIPTGEIRPVDGTALDFRKAKKLKIGLGEAAADESTVLGYDHNFVLKNTEPGNVRRCAYMKASNGRVMEVFTDQPGVQLYTARELDEAGGKDGMYYGSFGAACFETQNFPNAINTQGFPDSILKAGEEYETMTVYRFSVE